MSEQLNPYVNIRVDTAGRLLKEWRRLNRIKQEVVASKVGVSQASVSRWENGHDVPSDVALRRIEDMVVGFERNELLAERAIISVQNTMRGLFRLDGMVFKAASQGFISVWPDFMTELGTPLEDRLVNESAQFLAVPENRRDLRLGRLAYVRGVSIKHVDNSGEGMPHVWTACVRRIKGETYLEVIYEADTLDRPCGILEVLTL